MPIIKRWEMDGALWGIWKVEETQEELRAELSPISCDEVELASYKSPSRKMEYLSVRVLLKELLGREIRILHEDSGKPYLADGTYHVSISHTKGYAAVALHREREVGIDIEQVAERVRKVTSRFVREDELPQLEQDAPMVQLQKLLIVWSAKETLFKVLNCREVDFLEHLHIFPFICHPEGGGMEGQELRTPEEKRYSLHYLLHPDFVCTYVVD